MVAGTEIPAAVSSTQPFLGSLEKRPVFRNASTLPSNGAGEEVGMEGESSLGEALASPSSKQRFLTWAGIAAWCSGSVCVMRKQDVFAHASGWVAPGRCRPGAPTDPDVRTLAHPVPRPTGSPSTTVPEAIRSSYGDMCREPRCVQHVSLDRVCRPALRFPSQGPPGRVPLLPRYYQSATTSCRPSHRASLPSLGGTSVALA
jgi:hypothetical protein